MKSEKKLSNEKAQRQEQTDNGRQHKHCMHRGSGQGNVTE